MNVVSICTRMCFQNNLCALCFLCDFIILGSSTFLLLSINVHISRQLQYHHDSLKMMNVFQVRNLSQPLKIPLLQLEAGLILRLTLRTIQPVKLVYLKKNTSCFIQISAFFLKIGVTMPGI